MDLSNKDLEKIEHLYENIHNDALEEQQSDTSKQWERIAKRGTNWLEKGVINPAASGVRSVFDYAGQAASGITKAATGVDLEKVGRDIEDVIGSGKAQPKPATAAAPVRRPPTEDLEQKVGRYLAPPAGSSQARDPVVRAGGSYGFFGAVKPATVRQPSVPTQPTGGGNVRRGPRGGVIVNQVEVDGDNLVVEAPAEVAPITGKAGKEWMQKNKQGKWVPITDPAAAKEAAARWKAQKAKASQTKPPKQLPPPAAQPPAAQPPVQKKPVPTTQPPKKPVPTPQSSPVAKYMAAAAAARKIQDPVQRAAEMEKVKQSGMEIWSKANPKLAARLNPDGTQKGTGQSVMAKQAAELRSMQAASQARQAPESGEQVKSSLPGGNYSVAASNQMSQRTRNLLGTQPVRLSQGQPLAAQPERITPAAQSAFARSGQTAQAMGMSATARNLAGPAASPTAVPNLNVANPAKVPPKKPVVKASYEYEPYDLVLEYLFSEGHADTLDEAHYVMIQMSSEHIQDIVEAQRVLAQKTINGVTVPGYVNVERKGGFLGIGGKDVPVRGSFKPAKVSSKDAARYNQAVDATIGTGSNRNAMPAYSVQLKAARQGHSGYMRVANPQSIPNTGAADRPTPQRTGDQNRALDLLRPDVPVKSTVPSTPENLKDPEFRRSGGWVGDPNAGRTSPKPKPAAKSRITTTDAEFDKKYDWAMNTPKSKPAPAPAPKVTASKPAPAPAAAPAPKPPTIQSQNVTTGGVKYERRTPTSAEMKAAKAAGGGESGIKAAVDVAKSNKVAATSPTPDLKPEAPKKKESLMTQIDDLRKMRKAAEERNK
jgi:hypothetical protein